MNEMPLNDRDFAEIRSNVLREIARRQRRNTIFAAASVAFVAIALVFVLMPRRIENRGGEAASAHLRTVRTTTAPPAQPVLHGAAAPPPPVVVASQPIQHHRKPHHRKPTPEPIVIASSEPQPLTIELQTANPDVRIIWIAK